jgi:hypothetical protein
MEPAKKGGLVVALGLPPKHEREHDGEDDGDGDHEDGKDGEMSHEEHAKAKEDAADEMFDSIKSNDKKSFRAALESYCGLHMNEPEDEGGDEDDSTKKGLHDDDGTPGEEDGEELTL